MRCIPLLLSATALIAADPRPNIVNILLDDQGARDAGWCGSRYYQTPRMDRFATQGVVCSSGYSNGANCQPSRAALMSGQYAPRTGVYTVGEAARGNAARRRLVPIANREQLAGGVVTWAEVLRDAGYATAHIGKWHLGSKGSQTSPQDQGFLLNIAGGGNGQPSSYFSPWQLTDLPEGRPGEHLSDALADAAVGWLRQASGKGPFALNFWMYAVHTPIQPREDDAGRFAGQAADGGQDNAAYAGLLYGADRAIGQVLDELDRLGLSDNTLVVLSSDNGGLRNITSNAPLRGGKGMLYEGGIRVPLAVRWPQRIKAGTTCAQPILSMDWHATFLAVAGCTQPGGQACDGIDVMPALTAGRQLERPAVYWHLPTYLQGSPAADGRRDANEPFRTTPAGAIRMGDRKLIEYFEDGGLELYDLQADPGESRNLATEQPEEAQRLLGELRRWRAGIKAPVPDQPNPAYRPAGSAPAGGSPQRPAPATANP